MVTRREVGAVGWVRQYWKKLCFQIQNCVVNLKYCPSCKNTQENEYHLLFMCPLYSHIRKKFKINELFDDFDGNVNSVMKIQESHIVTAIAFFVRKSLGIRAQFIESNTS